MTDFKGSGGDASRIRRLATAREEQQKIISDMKLKIRQEAKTNVRNISSKFAAIDNSIEEQFKQQTIGLVTSEEFRKKRELLEKQALQEKRKREQEEKKRKQKRAKIARAQLSFDPDGEEEGEENGQEEEKNNEKETVQKDSDNLNEQGSNHDNSEQENGEQTKRKKFGKNPFVDTTFLPDREREEEERRIRQQLAEEWEAEQNKIKNEIISVTYSFYDGTGHRRTLDVKKGIRIDQFLELVRQEFHELRGVSAEQMLFIKEDVIIPHHYSFYDLIVTKAKGKSGPLWNWDVHEDIRVLSDATKEKDESHAAKVVERRWYERNKHIFPASRWEVYNPEVKRDRYTIHGDG